MLDLYKYKWRSESNSLGIFIENPDKWIRENDGVDVDVIQVNYWNIRKKYFQIIILCFLNNIKITYISNHIITFIGEREIIGRLKNVVVNL